jgi:hypothetical protein
MMLLKLQLLLMHHTEADSAAALTYDAGKKI